jgi:site-specific DNA recombinase
MTQKAILYIRVSTDEQADKGYSLQHQEERLRKYCELQNIQVLELFKEDYSAKTFNRPEFAKLLAFLNKNRHTADLLLFTKWDRFSRNAADAYSMINTLTKLGVEPQGIEQPLDLTIPENKIMLAFYLAAPEVENDRRALNVTVGMRRAKKEGRWMATAPKGYKNARDENNRPIIVPSEDAHIIKWAFEEVAKGVSPADDARKICNKKGLVCSKNNFYKLLRNSVYCGRIFIPAYKDEEESYSVGKHEPIITKQLFYEVQDVLDGRRKVLPVKNTRKEELPLRGFLQCPRCGGTLTGSASKGTGGLYYYYHCMKGCKERVSAKIINKRFIDALSTITANESVIDTYFRIMEDTFKANGKDNNQAQQKIQEQINKNRARLDNAQRKMLDEEIDGKEYRQIKTEYESVIDELIREKMKMGLIDDEYEKYLSFSSYLLKNLDRGYEQADIKDKQKIISVIFPEKLIFESNGFRTKRVRKVLERICAPVKGMRQNKSGLTLKFVCQSTEVTPGRLELPTY